MSVEARCKPGGIDVLASSYTSMPGDASHGKQVLNIPAGEALERQRGDTPSRRGVEVYS